MPVELTTFGWFIVLVFIPALGVASIAVGRAANRFGRKVSAEMNSGGPAVATRRISEDGQWVWDGQSWTPVDDASRWAPGSP